LRVTANIKQQAANNIVTNSKQQTTNNKHQQTTSLLFAANLCAERSLTLCPERLNNDARVEMETAAKVGGFVAWAGWWCRVGGDQT
jgi:hypothetical protein